MSAAGDTYATLLTASGVGAIGVIRVIGTAAFPAIAALFRTKRGQPLTIEHLSDGRLRYGNLFDGDEILDDVLIAAVPESPLSAFDITAHGGIRVLERILAALEARGAPFHAANSISAKFQSPNSIADEALTALRRARTPRAVKFLAHQRTALPFALTAIQNQLPSNPAAARSALAELLHRATAARHLIDGLTVVLIGPPNSGKSTLFNRLVGRPAAIVSPQPGTTRDWITAELDVSGLPVTLIDTAGLRLETDALEREAIARGQLIAHSASIRLLILDAAQPPSPATLADFTADRPLSAIVYNKTDLLSAPDSRPLQSPTTSPAIPALYISAATGHNLGTLNAFILHHTGLDLGQDTPSPAFFTMRQQELAANLLATTTDQFPAAAAMALRNLLTADAPENP